MKQLLFFEIDTLCKKHDLDTSTFTIDDIEYHYRNLTNDRFVITTFKKAHQVYDTVPNLDMFIALTWPDVQDFMVYDGFEENSILINDDPLIDEYGNSSYLVRRDWHDRVVNSMIKESLKEKDNDNK